MKFSHNAVHVVSVAFAPETENRQEWAIGLMDWLEANIHHPYQSFYLRTATMVTEEMIKIRETTGDSFGELWMFMFEEPSDAVLFKLTWGG